MIKENRIKKQYRFITIHMLPRVGKPHLYTIWNNKSKETIGCLQYCPEWKQYVFMAAPDTIWSVSCLDDVNDFIKNEIPDEI